MGLARSVDCAPESAICIPSHFVRLPKSIANFTSIFIAKNRKIVDFSLPKLSQNPTEMPLKSMSQKTCDFSSIFDLRTVCCKSADINFVLVFPILFACRTLFFKSLLACLLAPKNLSKPLPKRCPNPSKIDAKNVLFLVSLFSGFGLDFGGSWASKLQPCWGTVFLPAFMLKRIHERQGSPRTPTIV